MSHNDPIVDSDFPAGYAVLPEPPSRSLRVFGMIVGGGLVAFACYFGITWAIKPDAPTYLGRAAAAAAAGDRQVAISEYKNALQLEPNDNAARERLARLYMETLQFELAKKEISKTIELGRKDLSLTRDLTRALVGTREFDEALEYLASVRKIVGNSVELATIEAEALLGKGERDAALAILEEAEPIRKVDQVAVLIGLANVASSSDQIASAQAGIAKALALDPNNAEALIVRARLHSQGDELPGAAADFQLALASDPYNLRAIAGLVDVLTRQGKLPEAKTLAVTALEKFGLTPVTRYLRGLVAFLARDYDVAEADLGEIVRTVAHPQALWALAQIHIERGQLALAEDLLVRLHDVNPEHLPTIKRLARLQMAAKKMDEAVAFISRYTETTPDDAELWVLLSDAKRGIGDLDGARDAFARAAELAPDAGYIKTMHAAAKLSAGDPTEAIKDLQSLAAANESTETDILLYAYLQGGDFGAARNTAQAMLGKPGHGALEQTLLGLTLRASGDFDQARAALQAALAADSGYAAAHFHLGDLELTKQDLGAARAQYQAAIDANSRFLPAYLKLAQLATAAGDGAEAARVLKLAMTAMPAAVEPRVALAEELARSGNRAEAIRLMREGAAAAGADPRQQLALARVLIQTGAAAYADAQTRAPSNALVVARGEALQRAGQSDTARAEYDAWLTAHPEDNPVHVARATLDEASGNGDAALDRFERVLKRDPDDMVALNNLAYALFLRADKRSLELAEHAEKIAPDNPQIGDTLGWILVKSGAAARGLPYVERAHQLTPKDALVHYHYAAALAAVGRDPEARTEISAALEDDARFAERDDAEALRRTLAQSATH